MFKFSNLGLKIKKDIQKQAWIKWQHLKSSWEFFYLNPVNTNLFTEL